MPKPLTILIGIPCLKVGGTEVQTLRLVEALTELGYHCVTVCYFEYDIAMTRRFEEAGNRVVCLSAYGRRPASTREVYRFLKTGLKRVVKEYRPDVAHIQYMAPGALPIIVLRRLGIKTILATLHTDADIYQSLRLIHFLHKHCVRLFTCVSKKAEQNFFGEAHDVEESHLAGRHGHITLSNCLAPHYPMGQARQYIANQSFTIGIVARLEAIKGVDFVMPAFAEVLKHYPDSRLIIVGDGSMLAQMERQQEELHIPADRIEWAHGVNYRQLPDYYSRIDIAWMPSRSEGFGLSALEAMAQGCPIVVSAVGGLTEIVRDNVDGLWCTPESSTDLATKTLALMANPELMTSMSQRARNHAEDYSFEQYLESIKTIYTNITSK